MSRRLKPIAAASYAAAVTGTAILTATLATLPLHGQPAGLVWVVVAMAVLSMAGALTPSWASPYTTSRKDERP